MEIRRILGLPGHAPENRSKYLAERAKPRGIQMAQDDDADIVIMNSTVLSRYRSREAHKLRALRDGRKLLVVVTEQTVTRTIEALQVADGIVFQYENLQHLPMILALMDESHISVPAAALSIMMERGLRRKILLSLTTSEQKILSLLGHGCTNTVIAKMLNISEGRAKYLIRSLLKKLFLQNRTQAAVFAARENKLIDASAPDVAFSNGGSPI